MSPVVEQFFAGMAERGDAPALSEGARQLSYRQLLEQVGARSDLLLRHGARRVSLALDNGITGYCGTLPVCRPTCPVCRYRAFSRAISSAMCWTARVWIR